MTLQDQIHWHLDEAERLDKLAADPPPKPPPVASITDMTAAWVEATIPPAVLRQTADHHRTRAVTLARKLNERTTR